MAFIEEFVPVQPERSGRHPTAVTCGWCVIGDGREVLLQLSTYGSPDRALPGKVTQTLQIDRAGAKELMKYLLATFPDIAPPDERTLR